LILSDNQKPIVVIIPSYNNERWVEKNLTSVLTQKYDNFKVIFIDDCSTDDTNKKASRLVKKYGQQERVTIIHNEERCGAMANWYKAIHSCDDNAIIVQLDGDDWLAHDYVLAYLNNIYANSNIWLTYGQFVEYPSGVVGYDYSRTFAEEVILRNTFRKVEQLPISHLRTFYAWLFKCIKLEDVLYQGNFYPMTCDKVIMACCIEMAARHHHRVPDVLYVYNNTNRLCDHHVNMHLQHSLAWYVLSLPPYNQLDKPRAVDVFDELDRASMVLIRQDSLSDEVVADILKHKNQYENIFVFYPEEKKSDAYTAYDSIKCVPYTEENLGQQIQYCLQQVKCHYVQLSTQVESLNIDTSVCVKLLKKTQVDLLYGVNSKNAGFSTNLKKLPRVSFQHSAFALYPQYHMVTALSTLQETSVWKKEALKRVLNGTIYHSIAELKNGMYGDICKNNVLGLLLDIAEEKI
jgi:glycosyltransferase involved in cell wall biosynthesis